MKLRILTADDVRQALPMDQAVEAMKTAYADLSAGAADIPQRLRLQLADQSAVVLLMPAIVRARAEMAVKVVSVVPGNRLRKIPTIHALVLALNPETGEPIALLEGSTLTAIRTGAGSGAATDVLARPGAARAAIIGSGVQARTQLEAMCAVRPIHSVRAYSPTPDHRHLFANQMKDIAGMPADIQAADSAEAAVEAADIICTATTSQTPVFDGQALTNGAHINAVGSFQPQMEELDLTTIRRSLIVVDSRQAALQEAGELIGPLERGQIGPDKIHAEIGEILNGEAEGRTSADQITLFKSVGIAVQDAAAAALAIANAEQADLGQVVEL